MTAPTALDRAARALAKSLGVDYDDGISAPYCRAHVRAVLAALAEPSPGMVEAGLLAMTRDVVESGNVEAVWAAMLAAAREGK